MDIFNINIHHITGQYLEYIKAMRRLDLEVAGEFVAMAATLLHIKSRMLLPNYNEEGEEVVEDPRKDLVQKLIEYQKFKELSVDLYKRSLLGRDVFARGAWGVVEAVNEGELVLEENPLFSLIAAYRNAVQNMKKSVHRVYGELQSIAARILEMKEFLIVGRRTLFSEMITSTEHRSSQILVTFLSLLELAKMGFVSVFQSEPLAEIYIDTKINVDRDVVTRVESYDSINAAQKADEIMSEAQAHHEIDEQQEAQMSLDESNMYADKPELNESQDGLIDAASDADIEAEERRLEAEEQALAGALTGTDIPEVEA
jgi:segregation and condensation protein A